MKIEIFEDIHIYNEKPKYANGIIAAWDNFDNNLDKNCKFVGTKNLENISIYPNTIFKIENNFNKKLQCIYLNIELNKLYKISEDQKIYEYFSEEAEILGKNKLVCDPELYE